jgi:hypothetical protein
LSSSVQVNSLTGSNILFLTRKIETGDVAQLAYIGATATENPSTCSAFYHFTLKALGLLGVRSALIQLRLGVNHDYQDSGIHLTTSKFRAQS